MAAPPKFFTLIPAGTRIDFIGRRAPFILISILGVLLSFAAMAYNQATRGAVLNFGIDFAGGSQVRLALAPDQQVDVAAIRSALEELGYEGSSAVSVPDAANEVLVRVKETVTVEAEAEAACEAAIAQVGDAKLTAFNHPEGGSKIFLKFDAQPDFRAVEQALTAAGCEGKADRGFGRPEEFPVEVSLLGIGAKLEEQLDERFGDGFVDKIVLSETVGAKVGDQLKVDGIVALLYALGFIFLYVMIRFDLRFAPGGIVALTHDAIVVVGAFALTWKEFNLQTIAALLTVVGYSINDTIVVFDRIRERVALRRDEPLVVTTNAALNDTLSRTLLTSGTTLLVVIATYVLGSGLIQDFAFALLVGIVVGTYSSLYIATPVFLWVNDRFYKGQGHLAGLADAERPGTGTLLGEPGVAAGEGRQLVGEAELAAAALGAIGEGAGDAPEDGGDAGPGRRRRRRRPS
jgi:preprotein translocase subunit SecF